MMLKSASHTSLAFDGLLISLFMVGYMERMLLRFKQDENLYKI